jgi:hypothetical protein
VEEPLGKRSSQLYELTDRVQCEKLGVDPDDDAAIKEIARTRYDEWTNAWDAAAHETRYLNAARKWNRASEKTGRVGKKILKLKPMTPEGYLIRVRVIETQDEILKIEPAEQLMAEIKTFAKPLKAA